jgi:hypothetical protein
MDEPSDPLVQGGALETGDLEQMDVPETFTSIAGLNLVSIWFGAP